jgi:hypothetical protein
MAAAAERSNRRCRRPLPSKLMTDPTAPGKPRSDRGARPRDELGRPLPWGSESKLLLLDYDSFSIEKNHALAVRYFNDGQFFSAHEAWEGAWRRAKNTPGEEFFKGLAQLGAGYTHYLRGNALGASILIDRGTLRIAAYGALHLGIRGIDLRAACEPHIDACREAAARGLPPPTLVPPQL